MKTALITGVGSGIGEALCRRFLEKDYFVIGTYHTTKPKFESGNVQLFRLDLSDGGSIARCSEEIKALSREINFVINNAGALFDEDEIVVKRNLLIKTLEINLTGTIDFTERILALVKEGGHIINISSSAGSIERTGTGHYAGYYPSYKISKAALNMFTRTLARRLRNHTVSSVHPGWVKTDMGGDEAEISPQEAAQDIFDFAVSCPETGRFWFKGKEMPW
jgi:NAD(P)-dependent dehydrogenase (short-subunit alcohol dehydrogenase family)